MGKTVNDLILEAMALHQESIQEKDEHKLLRAQEIYHSVLNDYPDNGQIIFTLGTTYLQQGLSGLAINLLRRAALFNPQSPEVWNNMGSAYKQEQNDDMAEVCYRRALSFRAHPDYYNNLATLYVNRGCPQEGIALANRGLQIDPHHAKCAWNLGLLELEAGDWKNGFNHYLAGIDSLDRFNKKYLRSDGSEVPFWQGEKGKRIVVYGEQGLGDEILFSSVLPDLLRDAESVVFDCHPRLVGLFKRSFPQIKAFYPDRKEEAADWAREYDFDFKTPIGNLPAFYRTEGQFPRQQYLTPDPEKVQMYRDWIESLGDGPYVGVAWIGGYKRTHAHLRNMKLSHLLPLVTQPGTFVSLQYTDVAEKVERFNKEHPESQIHHNPDLLTNYDYDDTVALIAALDLVVCINTTAAHVCGAIGKECWTLTPHQSAWRYPRSGEPSPFYGDWLKCIHKGENEAWSEFMPKIGERYQAWLKNR